VVLHDCNQAGYLNHVSSRSHGLKISTFSATKWGTFFAFSDTTCLLLHHTHRFNLVPTSFATVPHRRHSRKSHPLCVFKWATWFILWTNILPHISHLYLARSLLCLGICLKCKFERSRNVLLQYGHWYGFSFVCLCMCFFRLLLNEFTRQLH